MNRRGRFDRSFWILRRCSWLVLLVKIVLLVPWSSSDELAEKSSGRTGKARVEVAAVVDRAPAVVEICLRDRVEELAHVGNRQELRNAHSKSSSSNSSTWSSSSPWSYSSTSPGYTAGIAVRTGRVPW